jgi:tetratricopeptide (TPR) repeat protein
LINLWAGWCAPCRRELADWTQSADRFRKAGLRVVALNVEGQEKASQAAKVLDELKWQFQSGLASLDLLDKLDILQRTVLDLHRPLSLPTSLLVDSQGRLAILYRGPVAAEVVLAHLAKLDSNTEDGRAEAVPFAGRWQFSAPGPDLVTLAERYRKQSFNDIAQEYLERSALVQGGDSRMPSIQYNLGQALARQNDWIGASEAYRKTIALEPGHVKAYVNLGIALRKLGDTQGAIAEYNRALQIDPNHILSHHNLAAALIDAGRTAEADYHYGIAQQLRSQTGQELSNTSE